MLSGINSFVKCYCNNKRVFDIILVKKNKEAIFMKLKLFRILPAFLGMKVVV